MILKKYVIISGWVNKYRKFNFFLFFLNEKEKKI